MKSKEEIKEAIIQIMMDVCGPTLNDIISDRPMMEIVGDSINSIEIMARIEETLNARLDPDKMTDVITVDDLVQYVYKHQESTE